MSSLLHEIQTAHTPESLVAQLCGEPGLMLLRSALFDSPAARYSFIVAKPFLTFRSSGSRCEISRPQTPDPRPQLQFGNPWQLLDALMARYEILDEADLPFPLGGAFGCWGYDLKNFVEPQLPRRAVNDLELPDCHVGFYDSLVVFDHQLGKTWIVATGLAADGSRSEARAGEQADWWREKLSGVELPPAGKSILHPPSSLLASNVTRAQFLAAVARAQRYIRAGDIYQVNLSQRLTAPCEFSGWELFQRLSAVSPAPFAAFLDCGDFQIASSSPELFLRVSGAHILTRPIKGTRPRAAEPTRDA
ncbi:MAG: chorismate-binding protein, partial [Verrucomicrobia bacterium]|nr:chorismate-binding protein [Verrucomicrobiota bacterium]